ncbi:MAG: bifunctional diaminohydroxyphosphoribosylaminopyrimidine deaminase/5-amino-6-(5-phosphoribosylamino)uracil reductase RibD [Ignavibacteria bacterium]|nr:bifunctional diaminohydroxyphosphoribosylaminopyrimidine deaminase/5-amino-6-(5-phosphoribosylamino)uracil reductase RibD [Ignavibacteria bacterium]
MNFEEKMMSECLKLARKGKVLPNPMVGCIILKNSVIIGKGYHKKFGGPHAEVNAINEAKKNGYNLRGARLFVTLEPCSHYGKTPPCTELIIKEGIKEVIIGMKDPHPLVNGKGISRLTSQGIKVTTGVLEKECKELNKVFVTNVVSNRPYIILKTAQSIDGKIALNNFTSKWITNIKSRKLTHNLRKISSGILIGRTTAEADNPELTVRLVKSGKNPARIVIDKDLKLKKTLKMFTDGEARTIVIHSSRHKETENTDFVEFIGVREKKGVLDLQEMLSSLLRKGIYSLIVEGGSYTLSQFLGTNLFDEMYVMIAPKLFGSGISPFSDYKIDRIADAKELILNKVFHLDSDIIINYKNKL